ncbi:kinase-like domain-containing protein [Truncatella angustata]|uniref:Kinase-like domain-containing protein n=1 Tax=Truncatella angustata TaxID=152316 RepID=A0A9P8ZUT6_9PEZI|nr:kinase-like domain-containing protein [Truncatella angustata]KAH6648264.1 kinase-like domain-containing protein [Truncatella angustata]
MAASTPLGNIARSLLSQEDLELVSCNAFQSLWAGYGHVCSIQATQGRAGSPGSAKKEPLSLILKYISPPPTANISDEGHLRKVLSYQVEQYFYTHLASQLPESVAVAQCIASISDGKTTALLLKDLKASDRTFKPNVAFTVSLEKRGELNSVQAHAALDWLAGFHGHFWGKTTQLSRNQLLQPPLKEAERQTTRAVSGGNHGPGLGFDVQGIWLNGGYTYLATRRKEYATLVRDKGVEWSDILCRPSPGGGPSLAERVAAFLAPSSESSSSHSMSGYETIIHGDVKSENMFASEKGDQVAFVDFQYVGLGLGVCDLAKLFTCSIPMTMLVDDPEGDLQEGELSMQPGEKSLLLYYLQKLEDIAGKTYPWDIFLQHWEIALIDWLRFQASWGFWGNTEWLEARVRYITKRIDI